MYYPKPKHIGGTLIRSVVSLLRKQGVELPLKNPVWIAVSGGSDSVALAHLLVHYGRRVVAREQIQILHIHHGWRPRAADLDQKRVESLAKKWKIPCHTVHLDPGHLKKGESWEDAARKERGKVFSEINRKNERVLTAHHADDLAETVIWRLATGCFNSHAGGILVNDESTGQIRPLLNIRKPLLQAYLREEKTRWREDRTNQDPRFLRARMRKELMPAIEAIFPNAIEHLVNLALAKQGEKDDQAPEIPAKLLPALLQTRLKRQHYEWLLRERAYGNQMDLPGNWVLKCEHSNLKKTKRWVLERSL